MILPPNTEDIEQAVKDVMDPFCEYNEENYKAFWDWYVIGGRFSGAKTMAKYDKEKMKEFTDWLQEEKVTVSGLVCGKQSLQPSSQIAKVDAKWNELFPQEDGKQEPCLLFSHSGKEHDGDIGTVGTDKDSSPYRVIVAGPSYETETEDWTGPLKAHYMAEQEYWNGVNWIDSQWQGTIADAIQIHHEKLENRKEKVAELMTVTDEWITVTVDYHS
jgi:hypothetical protein